MDTARLDNARHRPPLFFVAAVCAIAALVPEDSRAQADDNAGPGVIVDLSSLASNGGCAPFPGVRGGLLMPGARTPVSQLHISASGRPVQATQMRRPLRRPDAVAARPASPAPSPVSEQRLAAGTVVPKVAKPTPPMPPKPAKSPPASLTAKKPEAEDKAMGKEKAAAKEASSKPMAPPAPPSVPRTDVAKAPPPPPPMPEKPASEPASAASKPEPEKASVPPAGGTADQKRTRIEFAAESTKLTGAAQDLLAGLVTKLKADAKIRLQLLAYAGGGDVAASTARRMSLSRALAVRSYLIDSGIKSSRIDVRALGNKSTEGPPNRVDIDIVDR